jgi:hypothetical protein
VSACPDCHRPPGLDDRFCAGCGRPFTPPEIEARAAAAREGRHDTRVGCVVALVLLLGLSVAGVLGGLTVQRQPYVTIAPTSSTPVQTGSRYTVGVKP